MSQILDDSSNYINASQSTVYALDGSDRVITSQPGPNLYGGLGSDFLGNSGDGSLDAEGGQGNDAIHGGTVGDRIYGGVGSDLLAGGEFDYSLARDGTVVAYNNELSGDDYLDGGADADALYGFEGNDTLLGGDGDDTNVNVSNGAIKDDLASASFYNTITGGLYGGAGDDFLDGGRGDDYLDGGDDADTLIGGEGNDKLIGGSGIDKMTGGAGNDYYSIDNAMDRIVESDGEGTDTVATSVSFQLRAGVSIEKFAAASGSSTDALNLVGNEFGQKILGNDGVNKIYGGYGNDTLTGNGGNDFFIFDSKLSSSGNVDTITDFHAAVGDNDTIRLDHTIFTKAGALGGLTAAAFYSSTSGVAHDASDRIIYESDTGKLYYDSNGNASGGSVLFAVLTDHPTLTASDFFIV